MSVAEYQNPYPSATDQYMTQLSKAAVLFGQWMAGTIEPPSHEGGMSIPENDEQLLAYVGSTNNLATITYKKNGTVVATQTFTYVGGAAADDDLISRIVVTY